MQTSGTVHAVLSIHLHYEPLPTAQCSIFMRLLLPSGSFGLITLYLAICRCHD